MELQLGKLSRYPAGDFVKVSLRCANPNSAVEKSFDFGGDQRFGLMKPGNIWSPNPQDPGYLNWGADAFFCIECPIE